MSAGLVRLLLAVSLCSAALHAGAEGSALQLDCADPSHAGPDAIKQILGGLYHAAPAGGLATAAPELQQLVSAATYCRARVQSPWGGIDRRMTHEWVALHLWIDRLAGFVALNASGDYRVDWKREYADFAAIYEFDT